MSPLGHLPRRWCAALLVSALVGALACEPPPAATRDAAAVGPMPLGLNLREATLRRARFDFAVLERDLARDRSPPTRRTSERCAAIGLDEPSADGTVLVLARDRRVDARRLIPLSLFDELARDELVEVRALVAQDADPLVSATPRFVSDRDLEIAAAALRNLSRRSIVAEVQITAFAEPRITRRVGAARSEWVPGILAGALVLYERTGVEPLCRATLTAHNRVADAPIAVRLRPSTRDRLVEELGETLHLEAAQALSTIAPRLRWPTRVTPRDGQLARNP